jgi:integrase
LVFPNGIPRASRLKVDAKRNGIEYRDESGRYADFHSLRYTWATFLQRNDIPQRFAMKLMRHSDMKLTAKVYTDETQLPIYDAIKGLPWLLDPAVSESVTSKWVSNTLQGRGAGPGGGSP